jgi:hypothetical protein
VAADDEDDSVVVEVVAEEVEVFLGVGVEGDAIPISPDNSSSEEDSTPLESSSSSFGSVESVQLEESPLALVDSVNTDAKRVIGSVVVVVVSLA